MTHNSRVIWDKPTRVLHWTLAACVLLNLFVLEEGEYAHEWSGYIAVSTVVLRILWSFWGNSASRLKALPVHPKSLFAFARRNFSDPDGIYEGHNPLAALAYIGIWFCILGLGISGWMMGLDAFWGEDWVEELHSFIATALQTLICIHLLGVFTDSFRFKRKTWAAMLTGRR